MIRYDLALSHLSWYLFPVPSLQTDFFAEGPLAQLYLCLILFTETREIFYQGHTCSINRRYASSLFDPFSVAKAASKGCGTLTSHLSLSATA